MNKYNALIKVKGKNRYNFMKDMKKQCYALNSIKIIKERDNELFAWITGLRSIRVLCKVGRDEYISMKKLGKARKDSCLEDLTSLHEVDIFVRSIDDNYMIKQDLSIDKNGKILDYLVTDMYFEMKERKEKLFSEYHNSDLPKKESLDLIEDLWQEKLSNIIDSIYMEDIEEK